MKGGSMPRPKDWRGSDMRARAEVTLWLKQHGGEYHDPAGLITGRMKADLGKGRALSQLLADMEHDGMIKREIHGRRTLSIKLVDDWGLADDLSNQAVFRPPAAPGLSNGKGSEASDLSNVDLEALAETLLARVIKLAHMPASKGAELERLKEKVAKLTADLTECRDALILARESEAEQRRQAESMRDSLVKLQNRKTTKASGGVTLREALSDKDRALLDRLMREVPSNR